MKDLKIIAGKFSEVEIPKDKKFLLHYFNTDVQLAFLKYYLLFGNYTSFQEHTGCVCDESLCRKLKKRYDDLVKVHASAKKTLTEENMETIHLIESGKFNLTRLKNLKE